MAIITRSSFAKLLWPGLNKIYGDSYVEHPMEWKALGFKQEKSNQAYEEDLGVSMFGLGQEKGEGDGIQYDSARQTYLTRYIHVVYGKGFIVTREQYEDNLYPKISLRKAQALAFGMRQTKEINAANIFNRAFSDSYTGGDGEPLCGDATTKTHPNFYNTAGTTTYRNQLATAADLSETSLEQACIDVGKWEDDRGLKIAAHLKRIVVPVDLQFEVDRIIGGPANQRPGTAERDINALVNTGKFSEGYTVNHYLTDTDAWFVGTDVPNSLQAYQRRGMEFSIDNDFDTENAKFKATERYVFGWTDPKGIFGSPGA